MTTGIHQKANQTQLVLELPNAASDSRASLEGNHYAVFSSMAVLRMCNAL